MRDFNPSLNGQTSTSLFTNVGLTQGNTGGEFFNRTVAFRQLVAPDIAEYSDVKLPEGTSIRVDKSNDQIVFAVYPDGLVLARMDKHCMLQTPANEFLLLDQCGHWHRLD